MSAFFMLNYFTSSGFVSNFFSSLVNIFINFFSLISSFIREIQLQLDPPAFRVTSSGRLTEP